MAILTHNAILIDNRTGFFFSVKGKNRHKFCKPGDYPTLQVG